METAIPNAKSRRHGDRAWPICKTGSKTPMLDAHAFQIGPENDRVVARLTLYAPGEASS